MRVVGAGGPARWWISVLVLVGLALGVATAVDVDADPSTPNLPDIVLVEMPVADDSTVCDLDGPTGEPAVAARARRRAFHFTRAAERWTLLLRRFHRSVRTDIPI